MTLRLKLFVLIAGLVVFSTTGVTAVALWRDLLRGQELLLREGSAIAASSAPSASRWILPSGLEPGGKEALGALVLRVLRSGPLDRVWIVDRGGQLMACASATDEPCPEHAPPSIFQRSATPLETLRRLLYPEGIVAFPWADATLRSKGRKRTPWDSRTRPRTPESAGFLCQ